MELRSVEGLEPFGGGVNRKRAIYEVFLVTGNDRIQLIQTRTGELNAAFKILSIPRDSSFKRFAIDGAKLYQVEQSYDRGEGCIAVSCFTNNVKNVGDGGRGNEAFEFSSINALENLNGSINEGGSIKDEVNCNIRID